MHPAYRSLIKRWRSCSLSRAPYIFPGDEILLKEKYSKHICVVRDFQKYVEHETFGTKKDKRLHLGLLPRPYSGSLAKARIFILLLNAGLQPLDYYAEGERSVRKMLLADIYQRRKGNYPFPSLDPILSWLGSARYWRPRLAEHVQNLMQQDNSKEYYKALGALSRAICVVQLVPYHSRAFGLPRSVVNKLQSTHAIKRLIHEVIVPEAEQAKALVIVARKAKQWGIRQSKNVIVYKRSESRAGYISLSSRGGKAILRFLKSQKAKQR
jgi:hypothetical protein